MMTAILFFLSVSLVVAIIVTYLYLIPVIVAISLPYIFRDVGGQSFWLCLILVCIVFIYRSTAVVNYLLASMSHTPTLHYQDIVLMYNDCFFVLLPLYSIVS